MKIFISQKMRGKSKEEIIKERKAIEQAFSLAIPRDVVVECDFEYIQSYKPELAFKDPITSLAQSLSMLAEADIVLVPKIVIDHVVDMNAIHHVQSINDNDGCAYWTELSQEFIQQYIKGCEFEFLIALSYGKKVYTYDEAYNFEEV